MPPTQTYRKRDYRWVLHHHTINAVFALGEARYSAAVIHQEMELVSRLEGDKLGGHFQYYLTIVFYRFLLPWGVRSKKLGIRINRIHIFALR